MTKSICKNLSLPLEEWLEEEKGTTKLKHTNQLPMAAYKIVADWEYYAILNLMETSDFRSDSQWIAQRLALSKTKVESCLQTLFDFDLIEETDGSLRRTQSSLRTSEDISNISLQSRHKKNLEEARRALAEVPVELREFSSMTMAIDSSKMSLAKKRIADFFEELSSELETGNQDEVYELAVQLFPRTNITRRKK